MNKITIPVVAVTFKGSNYMCVEDSDQAKWLREANRAWTMGYDALSKELFQKALNAPGCAFEARENVQSIYNRGH